MSRSSLVSAFGILSLVSAAKHGPFEVSKENVTVGGYVCGGDQGAFVYYPTDHDKLYPVVSFAHGDKAGGDKVDPSYKELLEGVASWGYVVIALKSAPDDFCEKETYDQIRSLEVSKLEVACCLGAA